MSSLSIKFAKIANSRLEKLEGPAKIPYKARYPSPSPVAFGTALNWLSYCNEHDEICARPASGFVPRRLVNVNLANEKQDPFLEELTEPTRYACLSYCWGPDTTDVLCTTKNNIEAHFSAIPMNAMPASVRDAVKVCRGLHIPYLWVDSLCILQGHREEWLHDSSKMDLTYLNSYLTIAALEPASCKLGFIGEERNKWLSHQNLGSESHRQRFWSLSRRGWCLQEELLPNRRLCFDELEMTWECLCRIVCECTHQSKPNEDMMESQPGLQDIDIGELGAMIKMPALTMIPPEIRNAKQSRHYVLHGRLYWLRSDDEWRQPTETRIYELWRQLVMRYTQRTLSFRTDKLAALAGISKMIRDSTVWEDGCPDEYLAGLWKKDIYFELTWQVVHTSTGLAVQASYGGTPSVYCAPSWSWASSDRPVEYRCCEGLDVWRLNPNVVDRCELMEAECIPELAGDSTGPLLQGRIQLKGALAAVELGILEKGTPELYHMFYDGNPLGDVFPGYSPGKGNVLVRGQNLQPAMVVMDDPVIPNIHSNDGRRSCWLKGNCEEGCCWWESNKQTQFYCFRLFSWRSDSDERWRRTWFLLLKKSSTGVFQRIGVGKQELGGGWSYNQENSGLPGWLCLFEYAKEEIIDII